MTKKTHYFKHETGLTISVDDYAPIRLNAGGEVYETDDEALADILRVQPGVQECDAKGKATGEPAKAEPVTSGGKDDEK